MEITLWDAAMIAGWVVVWMMGLLIIVSAVAAYAKNRQKKKELYDKLRKSVETDEDFERIVRTIKNGNEDNR